MPHACRSAAIALRYGLLRGGSAESTARCYCFASVVLRALQVGAFRRFESYFLGAHRLSFPSQRLLEWGVPGCADTIKRAAVTEVSAGVLGGFSVLPTCRLACFTLREAAALDGLITLQRPAPASGKPHGS
jgi:hypothetical protein